MSDFKRLDKMQKDSTTHVQEHYDKMDAIADQDLSPAQEDAALQAWMEEMMGLSDVLSGRIFAEAREATSAGDYAEAVLLCGLGRDVIEHVCQEYARWLNANEPQQALKMVKYMLEQQVEKTLVSEVGEEKAEEEMQQVRQEIRDLDKEGADATATG